MTAPEVIKKLKQKSSAKNIAGAKRFGIFSKNILGAPKIVLDNLVRETGKDSSFAKAPEGKHKLALALWESGVYEARILAGFIDKPEWITSKQMDAWTRDFDSWAVCDSTCMHLFSKAKLSHKKVWQYARAKEEYVRRTAFALMATLAVHDKQSPDKAFLDFFPLIKKYATDERNFVRKAVNWALRQIGKRNLSLNKEAIKLAEEISKIDSKSAKWIAADALRELRGEAVQQRLKKQKKR